MHNSYRQTVLCIFIHTYEPVYHSNTLRGTGKLWLVHTFFQVLVDVVLFRPKTDSLESLDWG